MDRDMVMRYHWGLGVGHVYSHSHGAGNRIIQNQTAGGEHEQEADEQGAYCSTSDCHDRDIPPSPVHPQSRLHAALFTLNLP